MLLTEGAKADPEIVARIKRQLVAGKTVVVTSGLFQALQGKGIEDIVELQTSARRVIADGYSSIMWPGDRDAPGKIAPAHRRSLSADRFSHQRCMAADQRDVGRRGFSSSAEGSLRRGGAFLRLDDARQSASPLPPPASVTGTIKDIVMHGFPVRLDGPSQVHCSRTTTRPSLSNRSCPTQPM